MSSVGRRASVAPRRQLFEGAMDDNQFDGLLRALSRGTSRRGALGLLAAAAGLGLREVNAKAKHHKGKGKQQAQVKPSPKCTPNKNCAKWCATVFGAKTAAAGQCTSAATTCQGPCQECGPSCAKNAHPDVCRSG